MFRSPLIAGVPVACSDGRYRARYPDGIWTPPGIALAGGASAHATAVGVLNDGAALYSDGFETGTLGAGITARGENGFTWLEAFGVTTSNLIAKSGSRSARVQMTGVGTGLRFDLGGDFREVTIEYDGYFPSGLESWGGAAYGQKYPGGEGVNDKFFRLWPQVGTGNDEASYGSNEKVGASTWRYNEPPVPARAYLRADMGFPGGNGQMTETGEKFDNFIAVADLGKFTSIKIYCKAPVAAGQSNGAIVQIWKNGTQIINTQGNNWTSGQKHSYRFGYLFGYANSIYDSLTNLFIDNVRFTVVP